LKEKKSNRKPLSKYSENKNKKCLSFCTEIEKFQLDELCASRPSRKALPEVLNDMTLKANILLLFLLEQHTLTNTIAH
jgi:hypothetical protein